MSRECKSHVSLLQKISSKLAYDLTMNNKPIIVANVEQHERTKKAEKLIYETIRLLDFDTHDSTPVEWVTIKARIIKSKYCDAEDI